MRSARAALAIGALAMALFLPALTVGPLADDVWWLGSLDSLDSAPGGVGPYDLRYDAEASRAWWSARGVGFWWTDPGFRWTFFRPAGAVLLRLQAALGGLAWQGLSWLGYGAVLALIWRLYRRALSGPVALLSLAIFATHISHLQTVWFASNAHTWLAMLPTLAGGLVWLERRGQPGGRGEAAALAGLGLGLLCGETALQGLAFVAAIGLVEGRRGAGRVGAAVGLAAAYTAVHGAMGHGTRESSLYLDPREAPVEWLAGGLARLPALASGALGALPADLWVAAPTLRPALVGSGLGAAALLAWLLWRVREALSPEDRAALSWLALGAAGTLPLVMGAPVGGRVLLWTTLGTAPLCAAALVGVARRALARAPGARLTALAAAPMALGLGLSPLAIPLQLGAVSATAEAVRDAAQDPVFDDVAGRRVLVLNLPDAWTALYLLPTALARGGGAPDDWLVLSPAAAGLRFTRISADTLEMTVLDGRLWTQPFERLFLSPRHGRVFTRPGLVARVIEADARGPRRVSFTFDPPPDDPAWTVLGWSDGALRPATLPELGRRVEIPWSPGPFPAAR